MIVQTEESATATDFKEGYYKKRKSRIGGRWTVGPWIFMDLPCLWKNSNTSGLSLAQSCRTSMRSHRSSFQLLKKNSPISFHYDPISMLVGGWALPLRMMEFVSWDDEIPNWMESHKNCSKPPTSIPWLSHDYPTFSLHHPLWILSGSPRSSPLRVAGSTSGGLALLTFSSWCENFFSDGSASVTKIHWFGGFRKWRYPNSWMVYVMENLVKMDDLDWFGGYPHFWTPQFLSTCRKVLQTFAHCVVSYLRQPLQDGSNVSSVMLVWPEKVVAPSNKVPNGSKWRYMLQPPKQQPLFADNYTIWLFNIAMENGPFIDASMVYLLKMGIFHGYVK